MCEVIIHKRRESGYNKIVYPYTHTTQTRNGLTFTDNGDGTILINGTSTAYTEFVLNGNWNSSTVIFTLEANKTYKIITASNAPIHIVNVNQIIKTWVNGTTYTPNENVEVTELILAVDLGKTFNNVLATPMIYEYDGTDKPYEEYGAMPSLDYPSEVRAVGDNVNLFDGEIEEGGYNGEDGEKIIAGDTIRNKNFINIDNYETIIFSNNGSGIAVNIYEYDKDYTFIKYTNAHASNKTFNKTSTTKYINFSRGNTNVDKIKIEPGEIITSYSPYGQGSVEIKKINKNWFNKDNVIKGIIISDTGATNTDSNSETSDFIPVFENETITIQGIQISQANNKRVALYDTNKEWVKQAYFQYVSQSGIFSFSFTVTRNGYIRFSHYSSDTDIQIEKGNIASDYAKHEEQSLVLDIQKPMLKGDYFDKKNNKEVHKWIERELTGTENIILSDTVDGIAQFTLSQFYDGDYDTGNTNINAYSNCYKGVPYQNSWLKDNSISIVGGYAPRIMTSEYSTVEEFKQMLAEKYEEGNPVKIYYKLINPKEIELTEEQKAVLQQLQELDLFAGTNNIVTAESLALLQMSYIADTQTYIDKQIDNKLANINAQILELAGGN